MAENSAIEWTDHTFNPWIGCTKVGPGCDHCYAADLAQARLGVPWGPGQPRRHTAVSTWKQPRAWDRRAARLGTRYRVFCASLADVFDNEVPAEWRAELFQLVRETPNLDWLFVTKRIGNAAKMAAAAGGWPPNVWLGATIVNQAEADRDLNKLRAIEGPRFRFLSMEPLLEPVAFDPCDLASIDWVIVGGESGPGARPMHPDWARSLRDQCAIAFVPFLFKQWGEWAPICAMSEEQTDACYHPAPECHPEASRRCKVNQCVLHGDGARFDGQAMFRRPAFEQGSRAMTMMAIGKKAAGRLLDGAQHDGAPIGRANLHGMAA